MMQGTFGVFENEASWQVTRRADAESREDLRRQQRQKFAEHSTWKRLDVENLLFGRFVEDTRTGERYRVYRGELVDAVDLPVIAWYVSPDGPVFLEAVR